MARELIFAAEAVADLAAIAEWLTQPGSGARAWGRLTSIRNNIEVLRTHPCLWPVGVHHGVRELPCQGGYRVLYEVHPDTDRNETAGDVIILRIYGPGQSRDRR